MQNAPLLNLVLAVALVGMIGWLLVIGQPIILPVVMAIIAVYVLTTAAEALGRVPVIGRLPGVARHGLVLLGFTLAVLGSVSTTPDEYLFFWAVTDEIRNQQLPVIGSLLAMFGFTQFPEQLSLTFSIMGGAFVGPVLASGRTMVARISPREMMSEVYGLFTLTGKATAFLAPFFVALVTSATQNQRAGFAVILVFLVAGLIGLFWVREERAELAPR